MTRANRRSRAIQIACVAALMLVLGACAGVQTPVVPTMTPDLRQTPTPAAARATTQPAAQIETSSLKVDEQGFADPAFRSLWERFDGDVASGKVSRSWYWGQPVPFGAVMEPYAESPGGQRLVQYFEKGRMEINDPSADPSQDWFVTSGLLTVELVSGRVQTGENSFQTRSPAQIPVAGDLDSPLAETPLYADFTSTLQASVADRTGQPVTQKLTHGGTQEAISPPANVQMASYDGTLGHNIPNVFVDYFDHDLSAMGLNWLFVMGHPISEPYWVNASFSGTTHLVLVQLFERRALSFDPSNVTTQKVEFTNIGLHYYRWRYHDQASSAP